MIILNATKTPKMIMTEKSELITIPPGGESKLMIASKNLISATIRLGNPNEIGIILGGGYELDIAKTITASIPYLYTSIEEARSKLIDPSINYQPSLESQKNTAQINEELKSKSTVIDQLQNRITELQLKLESSIDIAKFNELEAQIAKLESSNRELTGDKVRLMTQVQELQDQVTSQTANLNKLREDLGKKNQELFNDNDTIKKLNTQVDELTNELDSYKNQEAPLPVKSTPEYKELESDLQDKEDKIKELTSEVDDLKSNLSEAVDKIENMKNTFNAACEKFRIYKDEDGEWQQAEN